MSDIKQLLEKATRKTEMRWRVFAFDPEQDNKLVHTSKDAFDCIKMAGEYKMDLAKKNPNYIIEIIAESKEQRNEAYKVGDRVRVTSKGTFGYGNTGTIRAINGDKFTIDFNAPNSGTIKLSAKDITKESAQKNESTRVESYTIQNINSLKEATIKVKEICKPANLDIAEKLGLFYDGKTNIAQYLPNAKQLVIFKESAQKNESYNINLYDAGEGKGMKFISRIEGFKTAKEAEDFAKKKYGNRTDIEYQVVAESAQKNEDYKKPVYASDFKVNELYMLPDGEDVLRVSRIDKDNVYYSYVTGKHANNHTYYISHPEINYKGTKWVDKSKFFSNRIKEIQDKIKYHTTEIDKLKKELNSLK